MSEYNETNITISCCLLHKLLWAQASLHPRRKPPNNYSKFLQAEFCTTQRADSVKATRQQLKHKTSQTNVQSNLAKGRIASKVTLGEGIWTPI